MELRQQDMMGLTCDSGEPRGVKRPPPNHKLLKMPPTGNIAETKRAKLHLALLRVQHALSVEWLHGSACSGRYNEDGTAIK